MHIVLDLLEIQYFSNKTQRSKNYHVSEIY